ncbi:hypothetical protein D1AOALGA4SA_2260 [Olavius algarvensis Delta 1 endosymbiont]|nr:hypothetical protein D1AOALGA4SA_2260 [Olavius algarvensis Delta 1 endosymbiont]
MLTRRLITSFPAKAIRDLRPAAAERRAGIQQTPQFYGIPVFAGMTGRHQKDTLFNHHFNIFPKVSLNFRFKKLCLS